MSVSCVLDAWALLTQGLNPALASPLTGLPAILTQSSALTLCGIGYLLHTIRAMDVQAQISELLFDLLDAAALGFDFVYRLLDDGPPSATYIFLAVFVCVHVILLRAAYDLTA
jgi:hypothetical protein